MEIITRSQAREQGMTYYFTGVPCVNGHISKRNTKNRCCYVCVSEARDQWQRTHKAEYNSYLSEYVKRNPNKRRETTKRYRSKNKDRLNADCATRKHRKSLATPQWLSPNELTRIRCYYTYAKLRERVTGVHHHVDHIVPIRGKTVCGLHVPWNLRVITASENLKKNNRFDVT